MSNLNPSTVLHNVQDILNAMATSARQLRLSSSRLPFEWAPEEIKRAIRAAYELGQVQATGALDEPKLIERLEKEAEQLVGQMATRLKK